MANRDNPLKIST